MKTQDSIAKKIARCATAAISHANAVEMVCLGGDREDLAKMIRALNEIDREADKLSQHRKLKAVIGHTPSKVETIILSLLAEVGHALISMVGKCLMRSCLRSAWKCMFESAQRTWLTHGSVCLKLRFT